MKAHDVFILCLYHVGELVYGLYYDVFGGQDIS